MSVNKVDLNSDNERKLVSGLKEEGAVFVKAPDSLFYLRDQFYQEWYSFLQLPQKEKSVLKREELYYQRGYSPGAELDDEKEDYFATPYPEKFKGELAEKFPILYYPDNVFPDIPSFKASYESLSRELHGIVRKVLSKCSQAMGLGSMLAEFAQAGPHLTRAISYPSLGNAAWHTDSNLMTVLPGARFFKGGEFCSKPSRQAGLYIETRSGKKISGTPPAGYVIVQVGQELEILTAGTLKATSHGVEMPNTEGVSRVTAAHFGHMNLLKELYPLEQLKNKDSHGKYGPPRLAGTYLLKRLHDIELAPDADLDKLGFEN